jgi:hypothetical protein
MRRFHPRDFTRSVGVSHSGHRSLFGSTAWKNIVAKTIRAMKIALKMIRKSRPSDIRHLATLRRVTLSSAARRRQRDSTELFQLPLDIAPKLDVRNTIFDSLDHYLGTGGNRSAFQPNGWHGSVGAVVLVRDLTGLPGSN